MLKSYEELLDLAQSKGLSVYENQPIELRGFIFIDAILLKTGLTEREKRAALTEEITHFDRDLGDITKSWRKEIRTRRRMIEENITLQELLDAIIDNKENGTVEVLADALDIPIYFLKEVMEYYSLIPFKTTYYRNCRIEFNPIRVYPLDDWEY